MKSETASGEWTDKFGRKRIPQQTFIADDGTVTHGAKAIAASCVHLDAVQRHNAMTLAQLKPHELARFSTWLRTRTRVTPPVRPPSRPANGHAPREARSDRRRGSRRGERGKSSSSDDPEPEPPRVCACGCGEDISHLAAQARYLDTTHRKRAQRARDRHEPERVVERRLPQLTVGDLPTKCRCHGEATYRDPEHAIVCVACGRPKSLGRLRVNGYDARLAEVQGWMHNELAVIQHPRAPREWRTRPSRKLSAKLRKTRGRWDEPACEEVTS
jgi:hypothetical protein